MIACIARQAAVRFAPDPPEAIWEWAATHVDFGLAPNYDSPIHGPYDRIFARTGKSRPNA